MSLSPDDVREYLKKYNIKEAVEAAVNDAVKSQADEPFAHIANYLNDKFGKGDITGKNFNRGRRVSLAGDVVAREERKKSVTVAVGGVESESHMSEEDLERRNSKAAVSSGEELAREFVKDETNVSELPVKVHDMLKAFFDKMDIDKDGNVTKEEAIKFWGKNFAKVNAKSMFNEVDEDGNESVSWDEFQEFWKNVLASGYPEEDVLEEVEMMLEGGSWVDWDDGRTT